MSGPLVLLLVRAQCYIPLFLRSADSAILPLLAGFTSFHTGQRLLRRPLAHPHEVVPLSVVGE